MPTFISKSERETESFARTLTTRLLTRPRRGALVLALEGDLGSGKTTFTRGLASALGLAHRVTSPTFLIMRRYPLPRKKRRSLPFTHFFHVDSFRIKAADLDALDWQRIIANPRHIIAIEWADRVKRIIPKHALWVTFSASHPQKRILRFPAIFKRKRR